MALPGSSPFVPFPRFPLRHSLPIQIRFSDIDLLGHVNNNAYMSWLDLGKTRYMMDVIPGGDSLRNVEAVVATVTVSFTGPTYFNDKVEVLSGVIAATDKTVTMEQRVVDPATGDVRCIAQTTLVGFDMHTARSAPIKPEWLEAIELYEGHPLR